MRMVALTLWSLGCVVVLAACSGSVTDDDPPGSGGTETGASGGTGAGGATGGTGAGGATGGTGAGGTTGGSGGGPTIGDVCSETGSAYCERVEECGAGTFQGCYDSFYEACCAVGGDPSEPSGVPSSWIDACVAAFGDQSCTSIEAQDVPTECEGT